MVRGKTAVKALAVPDDTLTTLYEGALGRVEYLHCSGKRRERGRKASSRHFHIVLPLAGSFVWHPGAHEIFADAATVVFAGGGEDFAISHPAGGDRSLVIWPNPWVLEEVTQRKRAHWLQHPAFAARTRRTTHEIQVAERALIAACWRPDNVLKAEECLARLLSILIDDGVKCGETLGANRTIARAKLALQERMPQRATLVEIARAAGVSPVYLTQLFRSVEGMPLYQYALNLRMAAALDGLAQSDDITGLAFDLGFSSHSHFTAAFRARFGTAPSQLRSELIGESSEQVSAERPVRPLCSTRGGTSDWLWS